MSEMTEDQDETAIVKKKELEESKAEDYLDHIDLERLSDHFNDLDRVLISLIMDICSKQSKKIIEKIENDSEPLSLELVSRKASFTFLGEDQSYAELIKEVVREFDQLKEEVENE